MAQRSALLNVMVGAAQKAARGLIRDFGEVENLQVSRKGPADFVSAADHAAEKIIHTELAKARPRYGFLMEESGEIAGTDSSNRWIVDPLDGTSNFLHGVAQFCISIGLERDGDPFAGVIYSPIHDEMFWAEKGTGTYLNGNRLRVSARGAMEDSLFATGIPFKGKEGHDLFLSQLQAVMAVSTGVRRCGSAALDIAYVAAGRFDGFWEAGLNPWDMAAGIVLVREAGGLVSDLSGGPDMMTSGNILAANSALHRPLAKVLDQASVGT